jgi:WD40 repeat protein
MAAENKDAAKKDAEKPAKPKPPEPRWNLPAEGTLYGAAFNVATGRLYVGGSAGTTYECDLNAETPALRPRFSDVPYVSSLVVLPGGVEPDTLVAGRYDGTLEFRELHSGRRLGSIGAHDGWIRDLCVVGGSCVGDGPWIASVGHDMCVKLWSREGRLLRTLRGHAAETPEGYVSAIYCVDAAPDGRHVAAVDRPGEVRVWETDSGREVARFKSPVFYTFDGEKRNRSIGGVRRLRFSPDGNQLALAGIGQVTNTDGFVGPCRMEIWDWRSAKRTVEMQDSHQAVLNDVLWSADGRRLTAAGGGDGGGLLVVWETGAKTPGMKIKLKGHPHRLVPIAGGSLLATAGFEGVQIWETDAWSGPDKGADATKSEKVSVEAVLPRDVGEKVNV